MTTRIKLSKDYAITVDAKALERPVGHIQIAVRSHWTGAKRPGESQLRFSVIVDQAGCEEIIGELIAALKNEE